MSTTRIKHISHLDLDGYGCTILSELMVKCFPDGMFTLETANILPNRLNKEIEETIEKFDEYDKIIVTDLAINQEMVNLINNCPDPNKFRVFDHHLTDIENLPDNFTICKDSPTREGKLSCATELYYLFLKSDPVFKYMITRIVPHNLSHFVQAVRIYDTFEFWLTRNDEDVVNNIEYSDAPRLNLLFHILPRDEFKEYIYDYINNPMIDWMTLTTSTSKYPWISKVLQLESDKNKYYVEVALKKMIITPFKYDVYRDGKFHHFDYKCGVIFAEKNGPMIGNTACETNSEIDFCAVVTNNQISMYTNRDNVDVSEIARALGGGGHKAASGFTIPYQSSNIYAINHFCDIVKCAGKISEENFTL